MKLEDIQKIVKKKNPKNKRDKPTLSAISQAAATFKMAKKKRGRKPGFRKTTKKEDKEILKAFHHMRPPGHGVDSRVVLRRCPAKLRKKIGRKTVIRRLGEKGYTAQKKLNKYDPGPAGRAKRVRFCKRHADWTASDWKEHCQAIADIKEFTYYPVELQPTFKKLRATWTYMTAAERKKPEFQRPKRWFKKKDWKKVKKQKAFAFTSSNGKMLAFLLPQPWNGEAWAKLISSKLAPWLKKTFRNKRSFRILIDGESVLHEPHAKAAFKKAKISCIPDWPANSPDVNPAENVWTRAEPLLRKSESGRESFEEWRELIVPAILKYPAPEKMVGSMAKRCRECIERDGAMLDH